MQAGYTDEVLRVVKVFETSRVKYMLTGAAAVAVFGVPRPSADIDVAVHDDRLRVLSLLKENGFKTSQAAEDRSNLFVFDSPSGMRVDVWFTTEVLWDVKAFDRRRRIKIRDQDVWLISPEELIARKLWRFRKERVATDLEDVRGMLSTLSELDMDYLEEICGVTRTLTLLRDLVSEARDLADAKRRNRHRAS